MVVLYSGGGYKEESGAVLIDSVYRIENLNNYNFNFLIF